MCARLLDLFSLFATSLITPNVNVSQGHAHSHACGHFVSSQTQFKARTEYCTRQKHTQAPQTRTHTVCLRLELEPVKHVRTRLEPKAYIKPHLVNRSLRTVTHIQLQSRTDTNTLTYAHMYTHMYTCAYIQHHDQKHHHRDEGYLECIALPRTQCTAT